VFEWSGVNEFTLLLPGVINYYFAFRQRSIYMLVLNRGVGEEIKIDDDVTIVVLGVDTKTRQVRLGFEADPEIIIHRKEIFDKINAAKKKILEQNNPSDAK
jgi:carbon storage regulator